MNMKMKTGVCVVAALLLMGARSSLNAIHAEESVDKTAIAQQREQWGEEVADFRLSLRSQKEMYAVGEAVRLSGLLNNVSEKDIWLAEIGFPLTTYNLVVIGPDGKPASLTEKGKRLKVKSERISFGYAGYVRAGESRAFSLDEFPGLYDMSVPGEYSLQISRLLPSREEPENFKKASFIFSNVLKIAVSDAETTDDDAPVD